MDLIRVPLGLCGLGFGVFGGSGKVLGLGFKDLRVLEFSWFGIRVIRVWVLRH